MVPHFPIRALGQCEMELMPFSWAVWGGLKQVLAKDLGETFLGKKTLFWVLPGFLC